mmetsp:Transcript_104689/g.249264  ORF Transcript_104689/g.249264 Transcript_104689/m.249264 type:complete len:200 (-) Transcript_104689:517-1116(-)
MRHPEAPMGWPMAMAPPLTFTLAGSQPISWLTASACAAKASFASMRSRSDTFQPTFSKTFLELGMGPVPMISGFTPALAKPRTKTSGVKPSCRALSADIRRHKAAPSLRPEALPAVTDPSFLKAGFSFCSDSSEESGLMYSSKSRIFPFLAEIGTIWSLNFPAFCASPAFRCDAAANSSWAARFSPYLFATFSAVTPMW